MYREVDLIGYLPEYLQNYTELKATFGVEEPELEGLFDELEVIRKNQFINDCDEVGVARFESLLRVKVSKSDTLEVRKGRALVKWMQDIPYTYETLKGQLDGLCGADGYEIKLINQAYYIDLKISLRKKEFYNEVVELLKRVVPCNIEAKAYIDYNKYGLYTPFLCKEIGKFRNSELREKVINADEYFNRNNGYIGNKYVSLGARTNEMMRRKGDWFNETNS